MKYLHSLFSIILTLVLVSSALVGCGSSKKSEGFPFTELTWENSYDDMVALEGESDDTYDSMYNGTTYTYPKKYLDLDGTIKYMYDADNKLMSVAWVYSTDTDEDLKDTYDTIRKEVEETHGESGYNTEQATNYGDVWYLDEGNIILSVMTTNSQKALQYSYLNPAVSTKEEDLEKK